MASSRQRSSSPPSPLSSPVDHNGAARVPDAPSSPTKLQASSTGQTDSQPQPNHAGPHQSAIDPVEPPLASAPQGSTEPALLVIPVPSSGSTAKVDGAGDINHSAQSVNSVASTALANPPIPPNDQAPRVRRGFFGLTYAWLYELIACLFAVLMVVIEIVLLAVYNKQSTDKWNHTWSINSVFAFLTTLLEAAIAFAVTSCLGQLRWLWFQKGNQELRWMDKLTNARQPSGALTFVISKGAWR